MHIGPPKTATSHIQQTAVHMHEELYKTGWCYPVDKQDDYHDLCQSLRSGENPKNEGLVKRMFQCLKDGKKLLVSSEKLYRSQDYRKIVDFFKEYKVHVIVSFRDPLSLAYSWYNQVSRDSPRVYSFSEHLGQVQSMEYFEMVAFGAPMFDWAKLYGVGSMTVLDFQGMIAAHKDPAYVILCELLGTMCAAKYNPRLGSNTSKDLRPAFLYQFVRRFVNSLGCEIFLENGKLFALLEPRYESLDFSTLPIASTNMEIVAQLARDIEKHVRDYFRSVIVYSNPNATETARGHFVAQEIDDAAFFQSDTWTAWLWGEVRRLQTDGLVSKKCDVKVDVKSLAEPSSI
eukprot:gene26817-32402_t